MHHWGEWGGWGWAGALVWLVFVLAALSALIALGVALVRRPAEQRRRDQPEQILAERFARGEIDEEEYQRRRRALQG